MNVEAALAAARFAHFGAAMLLVGAALFPFYAGGAHAAHSRLFSACAFVSALGWSVCLVLRTTGDFSQPALGALFVGTGFGRAWLAHLAFGALMLALAARGAVRPRLNLLVAMLHLATLAGIGHAARDEGLRGIVHQGVHALHLLAAGAWLGGLTPLARRLRAGDLRAAQRFSRMGYVAAPLIVITGLGNLFLVTGAAAPDAAALYGRLAAAKLGLFAALLGLAAFNRLYAAPRGRVALILRAILIEQCLLAALLAVAAALGMSAPDA
jgi:putative copper resistance protein D